MKKQFNPSMILILAIVRAIRWITGLQHHVHRSVYDEYLLFFRFFTSHHFYQVFIIYYLKCGVPIIISVFRNFVHFSSNRKEQNCTVLKVRQQRFILFPDNVQYHMNRIRNWRREMQARYLFVRIYLYRTWRILLERQVSLWYKMANLQIFRTHFDNLSLPTCWTISLPSDTNLSLPPVQCHMLFSHVYLWACVFSTSSTFFCYNIFLLHCLFLVFFPFSFDIPFLKQGTGTFLYQLAAWFYTLLLMSNKLYVEVITVRWFDELLHIWPHTSLE